MRLAFLFWAGRWFFLRLGAKETFLWRLFEKKKKCCCKKGISPVLLWQKGVVGMREPKQYLFLLACLGVCVFALLLGASHRLRLMRRRAEGEWFFPLAEETGSRI